MSGYLGNLSARQQTALDKFREAVADVKRPSDTDATLLRWLRARDFDVPKAEKMYRHDIDWRKANGVDEIAENYKFPEVVKENFPGIILHPCKDGRPMWLIPAGFDITAFVAALTPPVMTRHCIYMLEYAEHLKRSSSKQADKEMETHYFVLDLDKFSLRQIYSWQAVKTITEMLQMMEDHFPECLEKCISINAPNFFPLVWKVIRPFLTERTANKVQVLGKDGWKETLRSLADPASLPAHYGGDLMGPGNDPRCRHIMNYGGQFEEGADRPASLFGEDGAVHRSIARRECWELSVVVERPGSLLSWRFQTASGDLAFGLRMGEVSQEPLVPLRRIEASSYLPQKGSWQCKRPGTYVLQFDNSYSWLNGKTLAYVVSVHPPEEDS